MDTTIAGIARSLSHDVKALDLISQNVANMQTPGYLAKRVSRNFAAGLPGETALSLAAGSLKQTGRPLDLAVQGDAFFMVDSGGKTLLTRAGEFHVDSTGRLVTAAGDPVLGEAGPIAVSGDAIRILPDGRVKDGTRVVGRLRVVVVSDPRDLNAAGGGLYTYAGGLKPWEGSIRVGALEQSNVDPGNEMVRMIEVTRHAQSLQHAMHAYDDALQIGINQLGDNH